MSAENSQKEPLANNASSSEQSQEPVIFNRSEALKKAIMRLKEDKDDTAEVTATSPKVTTLELPQVDFEQVTERLPVADLADRLIEGDSEEIVADIETVISSWDMNKDATLAKKPSTDESKALVPASSSLPSIENDEKSVTRKDQIPWTLQQFFDGEIDLDVELSKRFPNIPLMNTAKFRTLGSKSGRRVATLASADGMASLIVDADVETKIIQMSFTYGSMMTLRFALLNLSNMDRTRWLELMRRDEGGLAFLWGPTRWQDDYLICIARKNSTNIYAFSPNSFESAIRLTPPVAKQLLDWIDEVWSAEPEEPDDDAPLLTW